MLATCLAAVAGLMTSSSPIARFDSPRAISWAICCSLAVSTDLPADPDGHHEPAARPGLAGQHRLAGQH